MAMRPGDAGVGATAGGEPIPIEEAYTINVVPSELFLKFRKELQNLRVGINLEVSLSLSDEISPTGKGSISDALLLLLLPLFTFTVL